MKKCCLLVLAVFFPCCAVMIDRGCGGECCATWLLSICGYIPGVIYAFIVILKKDPLQNQPIVMNTYVGQATPTAPPMVLAVDSFGQRQFAQHGNPLHDQAPVQQADITDLPPPYPIAEKIY